MTSTLKIIVIFHNLVSGEKIDIEIPINLSANELINGLNKGFNLGIDISCAIIFVSKVVHEHRPYVFDF